MVKKTDIVLPDDVYAIFLKPIAQKMGIRYIPRNSGLLLRSIFKKFSEKTEALDTKKLKEILKSVEKIVAPVETFIKIIATFGKPIFAVIPPQYAIIIIAVILIPTVFLPMMIIGLVFQYYLENWLKVPFVRSKREVDKIPLVLQKNILEVNQISSRTLKMPLKKWVDLGERDRLDYFHEASEGLKFKLRLVEGLLELDPSLTSATIEAFAEEKKIDIPNMDEFTERFLEELAKATELDYNERITITKHIYRGWRKLLPPILTRSLEIIIGLFGRATSEDGVVTKFMEQFQEHPARTLAKYFTIGWLGFLF